MTSHRLHACPWFVPGFSVGFKLVAKLLSVIEGVKVSKRGSAIDGTAIDLVPLSSMLEYFTMALRVLLIQLRIFPSSKFNAGRRSLALLLVAGSVSVKT